MRSRAYPLVIILLLLGCDNSPNRGQDTAATHPNKTDTRPARPAPVAVERAWYPGPEISQVVPDPGFRLVAIQLAPIDPAPLTLKESGTVMVGTAKGRIVPVGAAAFSMSNFQPFAGFVSGSRMISDSTGSEVKIGRDGPGQPVSIVLSGKAAKLILVYIVPGSDNSLTLAIDDFDVIPVTLTPAH